jgi:putative membrane protein
MDKPAEQDPRVYLAAERTFLAWIRTGLGLMGVGFAVSRFGLFLRELSASNSHMLAQTTGLSLWSGVMLVALGVVVTISAVVRHFQLVRELRSGSWRAGRVSTDAVILGLLLAALGIAMALYLTLFRWWMTAMNAADFRRLALRLDGAEEGSHMGSPDFRVGGRIFATLAHQHHGYGNLMLSPAQQAAFVEEQPGLFLPVAGGWGRMGATHIRLAAAKEDVLAGALHTAWKLRIEKNDTTAKTKGASTPRKPSARNKETKSRKRVSSG